MHGCSNNRSRKTLGAVALGALLGILPGCLAEEPDGEDGEELVDEAAQAITWNGHDYVFFTNHNTWAQAVSSCKANGYYLVTVNDATEQQWLHSQQVKFGGGAWWIGLNDRSFEGSWAWVAGAPGYRNWAPGEPNNAGGAEDCVVDRTSSKDWNDRDCSTGARFICERNL